MLYKFERLAKFLTKLGYPDSSVTKARLIKRDLTQEEKAGNIGFRDDGIYLTINGKDYKGYMYIKEAFIVNYNNTFPKFHIANCEVIQQQRLSNKFDNKYFWHNSNKVNLVDIQTKKEFKDIELEMCYKCKLISQAASISNTSDFFNLLDKGELLATTKEVEIDIFGYTLDWPKISRAYRIEKDFTCERCKKSIEKKIDREFIQVHHKNGNKLNNSRNNLECLCILCHSNVDELHKKNFSTKNNRKHIEKFLKKYGTK